MSREVSTNPVFVLYYYRGDNIDELEISNSRDNDICFKPLSKINSNNTITFTADIPIQNPMTLKNTSIKDSGLKVILTFRFLHSGKALTEGYATFGHSFTVFGSTIDKSKPLVIPFYIGKDYVQPTYELTILFTKVKSNYHISSISITIKCEDYNKLALQYSQVPDVYDKIMNDLHF